MSQPRDPAAATPALRAPALTSASRNRKVTEVEEALQSRRATRGRASPQRAEGTLSAKNDREPEELPGIYTPSPRARHRPEISRSPAHTLAAQARLESRVGENICHTPPTPVGRVQIAHDYAFLVRKADRLQVRAHRRPKPDELGFELAKPGLGPFGRGIEQARLQVCGHGGDPRGPHHGRASLQRMQGRGSLRTGLAARGLDAARGIVPVAGTVSAEF